MAGTLNLTVDQDTTFAKTVLWNVNSNPVNLSGYTATLVVGSPARTFVTLTSASGAIVLNSEGTGYITWTFTPAQTSTFLEGNKNSYYLDLTSSTGVKTRLLRGMINCVPKMQKVTC